MDFEVLMYSTLVGLVVRFSSAVSTVSRSTARIPKAKRVPKRAVTVEGGSTVTKELEGPMGRPER